MDTLREEFEADFENETGWSAGDYPGQDVVDLCWRLYQQSRARIVVELPRPSCVYADHSYPAYSQKQVEGLLNSIGLSIKGE